MRIYSIKPKFQKLLEKDRDLLVRFKIGPTTINILALVVSIIAGFILAFSSINLYLLLFIPLLAFIRTAFNALDGMVARKVKAKNQKFGEVLNEFIDRLSDSVFFIGLAFAGYTNIVLCLFALICVLLVSYLGIVGKAAGGSRQYVGLMGKADRMFWLSVACIFVALLSKTEIINWFLWFVIVLSVITIVQRFLAIKKELYKR